MVAALAKYDKSLSGIPSGGLTGSYLGADLMIQGLEVAGSQSHSFVFHFRAA